MARFGTLVLVLAAIFAVSFTSTGAAQSAPASREAAADEKKPVSRFDFADFHGSDTVLLSAPGFDITEREFFLYSVLTNQLALEDVVNWQELENERKIRNIRLILDQQLKVSMMAQTHHPADPDFRERAVRALSGPAASLIWADTIVRQSLNVFPEDILYHVKRNRNKYFTPSTVIVRRLRVPVEEDFGLDSLVAARERARLLRERAVRGEGLAELLRLYPDLLVDPPGRTIELTRNNAEIDPQILDEAFSLGVSQISEPLQTPGGYMLVEVVERIESAEPQISSVEEEVTKDLVLKFLPLQYEYLVGKKIRKAHPSVRPHLWQFLPDDAALFRVRGYEFYKGDFKKLFPEIVAEETFADRKAITFKVMELMTNEVVMQDLEKNGLLATPMYDDARAMSEMFFDYAQEVRRRRAEINPTDEELAEYERENPEKFIPGPTKVVYRYSMSIRDPEDLTPGERDSLRILMRAYMQDQIASAQQQIRERAAIAGEGAFPQMDKILRNLELPDDRRIRTNYSLAGYYNRFTARNELPVDYDSLELGDFTDPAADRSGDVNAYYVAEELPEQPLPEDLLRRMVRLSFIVDRAEADLTEQIEQWENDGSIRWHPALQVDEEP